MSTNGASNHGPRPGPGHPPRPEPDRDGGRPAGRGVGDGASTGGSISRRRLLQAGLVTGAVVGTGTWRVAGSAAAPTMAPMTGPAAPATGTTATGARITGTAAAPPSTTFLQDAVWLGIHYLPSPTIALHGQSNAHNASPTVTAIGGTSWKVYNMSGAVVGRGTMAKSASTITVCSHGAWAGGTTAAAGHYTVATDSGAVGNVVVCPSRNHLYTPRSSGDQPLAVAAWLGSGPDRDYYSIPGSSPAQIVAAVKADPYFAGPQDAARPRQIWISSNAQATSPTEAPTPAQWAAVAQALAAAGHPGAWYECPTNEPENGGWSMSAIVSYWNACRSAIVEADPQAHVMGYCSGGIFNNSSLANIQTFLAECPTAAFTNHMENSHENLSNIVALRQYFGAIKQQFTASGRPNLNLWLTETGINGGLYGVLHPRRDARQRTLLRFVGESFGWAKEFSYDFPIWDHQGAGITSYMVDGNFVGGNGNLRAGAYALHVMSEALYGTTCTPARPPATLSFGPAGGVLDSLFAGLHYRGTVDDVVVLATNGLESATVTLEVDAPGPITWWSGMGVAHTAPVTNGRVSVTVSDLLTYVFLPRGTTVSVAPSWASGRTNLLRTVAVADEHGRDAPVVHNGSFAENAQFAYGVPGAAAPYTDGSVPGSLSATTARAAAGFALMTSGPAWQQAGCSLTSYSITAAGSAAYTYTCPSAVTLAVPSASNGNSSDPCTLTTWWTAPFAWLVQHPLPAGPVELLIHHTGYGGQPDTLSSTNPTNSYAENDPQQIQLTEWQVLA